MKKLQSTVYSLRSRRGFTLLFASLIGALMLAIGLSIFNLIFKELVLSSTISESQSAFTAADSAAECALFWDTQHPGYSNSIFGGDGQNIVPNGLVGYWKFDEGPGTGGIAPDSAGNNDGTLTNMASADWVEGKINNALDFDGSDDYVDILDSPSLSFTGPGISIAAWVNLNSLQTGERAIVRKNNQWQLGIFPTSGTIRGLVRTDGTNGWVATNDESFTFQTGRWYHMALTYSGSELRLYVDGNQIGSPKNVTGNIVDSSNDVAIGSNTDDLLVGVNDLSLNAVLDEVRIYDRALTLSEISILNDQTAPDGAGPVGEGSSLSCNGSDITDPVTGWDDENGWDITLGSGADATTVFDLLFNDQSCAEVTVIKEGSTTTIDSRGYNSCAPGNPRRVERGIRITY